MEETVSDPSSDETNTKLSSIADRRKLYENRSLSQIEEKKKSVTVGRGESFKESDEHVKDRTDSKVVHQNNGSSVKSAKNSKRTSTVFGKVSKFRHLKGTTGHKSTHIENIKNINRQLSGECDGFHGKNIFKIHLTDAKRFNIFQLILKESQYHCQEVVEKLLFLNSLLQEDFQMESFQH